MMIILLIIALCLVVALNIFSLYTYLYFWNKKVTFKLCFWLIIAFNSVSFIFSTILVRWQSNFFTEVIYLILACWLGFLSYLFLGAVLLWLIWLIKKIFRLNLNLKLITASLLIFILFIISLAIYQGFNYKVKNIEVKISNLPETWQNKKIVQLSDLHLGAIYNKKYLERIISSVAEQEPRLIVITGDLFDGGDDHIASYLPDFKKLSNIAPVIFINGNHEIYHGYEEIKKVLIEANFKVLENELINLNGLDIVGLKYPDDRSESINLYDALKKIISSDDKNPKILLYHSPLNFEQAKFAGINLQLSGHTHQGQFFPFNLVTKAVYSGHDYGLFNYNNYSLYVTSGAGTWGPPLRLGSQSELVVIKLIK